MEVLTALCEVALIPEEGRTLAEALIEFFEAHGRVEKLLFWAISKEVRTNSKLDSFLSFAFFFKNH